MQQQTDSSNYSIQLLTSVDVSRLRELLTVFGEAFEEIETYKEAIPSDAYLTSTLSKPHIVVLTALQDEKVIGGLVAYELDKFEQDRREMYIYDLAVAANHRRRGVATSLILELKRIAKERNVYVIYVQADKGDTPAIRLYESLGTKEEVLHFDIAIETPSDNS